MTIEQIERRRAELASSATLRALFARLESRSARLLASPPVIPAVKATLSADGGFCPADGAVLVFDPGSPTEHRCRVCGNVYTGARHDQWWARYQHLWLVERAAEMATVAAVGGDKAAARGASGLLVEYARRYLTYPNRDNVLGPSRLFSSTYAESIWILNYLATAWLLRECGALDGPTASAVHQVADEAANLIGEFDEGFSNRQTWNDAALAAIAVWFEDEDLGRRAIESETGLIAHLRGYRRDGLWYEGENYHLFALRGFVTGAGWARHAGVDFAADPALVAGLERALLAPSRSALPDLTFPARKDARFGVSLAQPMYLDTWEVALGRAESEAGRAWLRALYAAAPQPQELFESYLHDAPFAGTPVTPARDGLSWWAFLEMNPEPPPAEPWRGSSELLEDQGLAVFRDGERYVSVECGPTGGGHGHPDRLHLTVHQDGVHWLPDFGTGSYVTPDLEWYRSTLAHNAPRLDGESQPMWDASCEMFDVQGPWGWVRGKADVFTRTVVAGPRYVLDVVELDAAGNHRTELPWHFAGEVVVTTPGTWKPTPFEAPFVTHAERFAPGAEGPLAVEAHVGAAQLAARL
ncbi:MAG TPA: heparinase II/III family protein, partial [Gemmatimonadales bacterium]|nr:heparinase II/III family protein [Gemmatimonadales bacterium]